MNIRIVFTEDSLTGAAMPEDLERMDVPASISRYAELLEQRLRAEYPDAEIVVE